MSTTILNGNDLFDLLNNNADFSRDWFALTLRYIPLLFSTSESMHRRNSLEIDYHQRSSGLSFSRKELHRSHQWNMISDHLRRMTLPTNCELDREATHDAAALFVEKTVQEIQFGLSLPQDIATQLAQIYATDKVNVAAACRATGLSRTAVQKLMKIYSADMYRRYQAVQQGRAYAAVMNDCDGYIQDHPVFEPVQYLGRDELLTDQIQVGDLVAAWGSTRFFTVQSQTLTGEMVYTAGGFIMRPLRHLSQQYRAVAHRFCGSIDSHR